MNLNEKESVTICNLSTGNQIPFGGDRDLYPRRPQEIYLTRGGRLSYQDVLSFFTSQHLIPLVFCLLTSVSRRRRKKTVLEVSLHQSCVSLSHRLYFLSFSLPLLGIIFYILNIFSLDFISVS